MCDLEAVLRGDSQAWEQLPRSDKILCLHYFCLLSLPLILRVGCIQCMNHCFGLPEQKVTLLSKCPELQKWRCPEYYENNVHKMQLPFSNKLLGSTVASEEKQEKRQQQLRRLQELNARRREEKLQLDQERLDRLLYVQVMRAEFQCGILGGGQAALRALSEGHTSWSRSCECCGCSLIGACQGYL